jgi:hypothetical protein
MPRCASEITTSTAETDAAQQRSNRTEIGIFFISVLRPNADIGHPKLFMAGEASVAFCGPLPAVNNFVAAGVASAGT